MYNFDEYINFLLCIGPEDLDELNKKLLYTRQLSQQEAAQVKEVCIAIIESLTIVADKEESKNGD